MSLLLLCVILNYYIKIKNHLKPFNGGFKSFWWLQFKIVIVCTYKGGLETTLIGTYKSDFKLYLSR
jgi:hypothetical protein